MTRYTLILTMIVFLMAGSSAKSQEPKINKGQTFTNAIGVEFVRILAGRFIMGEATREECRTCNANLDETPRHYVTISKAYYISKYEITQKQWLVIMKANVSRFTGDNQPVEYVSWNNVQLFISALNSLEKTNKYRLPTEAEWEYAARAGSQYAFCFGDDPGKLGKYAWYSVNSGFKTHKVGQLKPNKWGLFDMHGNVFEWCKDFYQSNYYKNSPKVDPTGPPRGYYRVRRGGSFDTTQRRCRSSDRDKFRAADRSSNTGFRLVMDE